MIGLANDSFVIKKILIKSLDLEIFELTTFFISTFTTNQSDRLFCRIKKYPNKILNDTTDKVLLLIDTSKGKLLYKDVTIQIIIQGQFGFELIASNSNQ